MFLLFTQSNMRNQFNFSSSSSAKTSSFSWQADKNTKSAFWLNRFLSLDVLFFRVRQNNQLFLSWSSNLQPWFKVWFCCFLPWVHKTNHWCVIFCAGSQCRRYDGARGAVPLLTPACPPISVYSERFFGASRNDRTTGNNGKRNNNFQTRFSFEVFSIVCKSAGHQLLYINVTQ